MFRPYAQEQLYLLPPSLQDFIDENHPVHMINDLVEKLDLTVLYKRYGVMGQPAYEPRLMLKVILYGFTVGIFSARKLSRACQENLAFQYLSGLEKPAFKTFIEFRRRHREDMREVFLQTVKLAGALGLAKLGSVALDGTKITANTSKHKAMSYGRMQEEERRLKEEIDDLLKQAEEVDEAEDQEFGVEEDGYSLKAELSRRESRLKKIEEAKAALEERESREHPEEPIDSKKQISFADTDARCFAKKGEGTRYVYNGQAAVDMESQVIVENHIENSVQDAAAAPTALQNMEETLEKKPENLVMDAGYANTQTLKSCQSHQVTPICSPAREGKESTEGKSEGMDSFSYDAQEKEFRCCHGTVFKFEEWNGDKTKAIFRSLKETGCGCEHERTKRGSILRVRESHLARRAFGRILSQPENQALYRRRKCTVEPVFGQIKFGMGFQRFFYRGTLRVRSEWNIVCAAFNLKKMAALLRAGNMFPSGSHASSHLQKAGEAAAGCLYRLLVRYGHLFDYQISLFNGFNAPSAQPI